MKFQRPGWKVQLGIGLVVLSAFFYFVHYLIFGDARHVFDYLLIDIAFVPIEVLLVTMIIHELLNEREKRALLEKMNMVIGTFYNEVGTELLGRFAGFDVNPGQTSQDLIIKGNWREQDFVAAVQRVKGYDLKVDSQTGDLEDLRQFMIGKRDFLLRMLENPNLLEHDTFTDLLWAVFHLSDELAHRQSVYGLPEADYAHLSVDIKRAYALVICEWVQYMRHLKESYPYLFSLAVRTNPLDSEASPVLVGS
jgi:hypothetical protein